MRSWKFSKSLSSVMIFGKGSSVLIPGFDSLLSRDANSTVSRLKWGTVTVLPVNLCGSWRTPPGFGLSQVTVCAGNAKIGRFKYNVPGSIIFWVFGFLRLYKDIHQCRAQSLWSVRQRIMFGLIWWSPIGFSGSGITLIETWDSGFESTRVTRVSSSRAPVLSGAHLLLSACAG